MSLCPELSKISNPNLDLIDWLESIKNPERRCEIFLDVGIQLKRHGLPNKKITRTYLQLSEKPFVRLDKLTDDKIVLLSYVGSERTTAVSEDEEYFVVSDGEIEEQQESNKVKPLDNFPVKNKESKNSDVEDNVEESKEKTGDFNSGEIQSCDSSAPLNALEDNNIENTSVIDGPQIDKNDIAGETNYQEGLPLNELEESNIDISVTPVIDKPQIYQSNITEETSIQECLLPLNALEDNNNIKSASVIDKPQIDQSDNAEKTSFQESLSPHNTLEDSNIRESVSVINNPQIGKSDITEETRFIESNPIQSVESLATKEKLKDISVSKRKSVIEKSEGNSLPTTTVNEILKVPSEKCNDNCNKNKSLNNVQKINSDINLNSFQLEKQLNDKSGAGKSLDEQLEVKSCTVNNIKVTSLTKCDESKEISNNGGLLNVFEEARTSNMKIKPTSNREELLCMQRLKEQIAKKLSKKNVHLPVSITNTLPILAVGKPVVSEQSTAKIIGEKPLISVRKNLFEHPLEKTLNSLEISAKQTNKTSMYGSNNKVSGDTNTNIGELRFSESSAGNKVTEHQLHKEVKSGPLSPSQNSNNFEDPKEGLKQLTAGLHNIKKMVELRKRLSQDSGDKIQAVKKRRLSEQISTSKGQEKQKQEEHLKDHSKTDTQNKSVNEVQISQKINIQYLLDSNVPCQSQTRENSETSTVNNPILSRIMLKESDKSCVNVSCHNQSISVERIPQGPTIGSNESLSESNVDSYKSQPLKTTYANAGNKPTYINSNHVMQEETNKASSKMKMSQQTATGRFINKAVSNLIKRQFATVSGNNPLSENQETPEANTELVINSLTEDSISFPENSTNVLHVAASSEAAVKDKTDMSHSSTNRLDPEFHTVLLNDQRSSQITNLSTIEPSQTAPPTSNHQTIGKTLSPDIYRLVEKAIYRFLIYFCNRSDENLGSIPSQVCSSLDQYCINQGRPPFTRLTEYLKLYMLCYIKLFNNEGVRKRISKIAELLHLSIADFHRKNERTEQAKKLQSEVLRREEISRAKNDYDNILALRGRQFADLFFSLLPNINQVKGCEFLMLVTFYFKTTQALTKIDVENNKYVFSVRVLMKDLLISVAPALPLGCVPFFKVEFEDFKSNYCFVKQCLLTLYMSGYFEVETETFWKLVRHNPIIPGLENILAEFMTRSQTVGSSGTTNTTAIGQMPSTLENLRTHPHQTNTLQSPINVHRQTNAGTSNPFQFKNQLNVQQNVIPQRVETKQQQQATQRPISTVRERVPSQLPPFASLNQPQLLLQQLSQRNLPASSNIQATQGMYHYANHGVQQGVKNSPSAPSQPQLNRQNVGAAPKPYSYPPPPYPGSATQQVSCPATNQLWQPGGSVNTAPLNIRIPANNHQNMVANVNVPSEEILSMTQMCSTAGCCKLATLVCSLCREAVYCTTHCQAQDWYANHSQVCLK